MGQPSNLVPFYYYIPPQYGKPSSGRAFPEGRGPTNLEG